MREHLGASKESDVGEPAFPLKCVVPQDNNNVLLH
jgi:hypothetical protein